MEVQAQTINSTERRTLRWRERDSNRRSPLEPCDLAMTETARGFRRPARTWRHVKPLRRRSILRA